VKKSKEPNDKKGKWKKRWESIKHLGKEFSEYYDKYGWW
jgi:hypothetical protein